VPEIAGVLAATVIRTIPAIDLNRWQLKPLGQLQHLE
jgi:hypothetical protein